MLIPLQGCLKTRAQLKGDASLDRRTEDGAESGASRGVSAAPPLQEVHPQGEYVVEELKDEITHLSGRIEDLERQAKDQERGANQEKEHILQKLETRFAQMEKKQESLQEAFEKLRESALPKDPAELMRDAKSLYGDGKYQEAAEKLAIYLKSPKVKNQEDAIFLRGECFYQLKQYKKAVVEYSHFPEKFTHSPILPDALYKIGLSFEAMGLKEDAKGFYQELVEKFPKSALAKKARKKLK